MEKEKEKQKKEKRDKLKITLHRIAIALMRKGEFTSEVENSICFKGHMPEGCWWCMTDTHTHLYCHTIKEVKKKIAAQHQTNPQDDTSSAQNTTSILQAKAKRATGLEVILEVSDVEASSVTSEQPQISNKPKPEVTDYLDCIPICNSTNVHSSSNTNISSYPNKKESTYLKCNNLMSKGIAPQLIMARVTSIIPQTKRHTPGQYTAILDNGTAVTMPGEKSAFTNLYMFSSSEKQRRHVIFGDGKSSSQVDGIGILDIVINGKRIRLHNSLFVQTLKDTLISIKDYMRYKNCHFIAQDNSKQYTFPFGNLSPHIGDEITISFTPANNKTQQIDFDTSITIKSPPHSNKLKVKLLHHEARLPHQATPNSAGYDIRTITDGRVPLFTRTIICTGLSVEPPPSTYIRIAPRSSLSMQGIDIAGGVVDGDYRGELLVIVVNTTCRPFIFEQGKKIAQIIVEKIHTSEILQVTSLTPSDRGEKGFGSTNSCNRIIQENQQ